MAQVGQNSPHELIRETTALQVWRHPNAKRTLISFSGLADNEGRVHFEFAGAGAGLEAHLVLLRDESQSWFTRGLPGLGDTPDRLAKTLSEILQGLGSTYTVAVGVSSGGYGALHVGLRLPVDRIVAFGPQAFIAQSTRQQVGDKRWQADLDRACLGEVEDPLLKGGTTAVTVFVGKEDMFDLLHAAVLADRASADVCIVAGADHDVARYLRDEGELQDILEGAVSGSLPASPAPPWLHFLAARLGDRSITMLDAVSSAIAEGGPWGGALYFLAQDHFVHHRDGETEQLLQEAIPLFTSKTRYVYFCQSLMARCLCRQLRFDEAVEFAFSAVQMAADKPGPWDALATVLEAKKHFQLAAAALDRAAAVSTQNEKLLARAEDLRRRAHGSAPAS